MQAIRILLALAALLGTSFASTSLYAFAHVWSIKEIFSNADGSVQFIELYDPNSGENLTSGTILRANSDGMVKMLTLNGNLSSSATADRHMLIATPGFATLAGNPSGVTPNFTLPDPAVNGLFFNPNATNLSFSYSASNDTLTFAGALLPKDGFNSLTDSGATFPGTAQNLSTGPNSPTPFPATTPGQIDLRPPAVETTGDYNGDQIVNAADYVVWRNTLGDMVDEGEGADGNKTGEIDEGDFEFWRQNFGNPVESSGTSAVSTSVPEPITHALIATALGVLTLRRRR